MHRALEAVMTKLTAMEPALMDWPFSAEPFLQVIAASVFPSILV